MRKFDLSIKNILEWIKDYSTIIAFLMFLVGWFISTLVWISESPQANISAIAFYALFLLVIILTPYLETFIEKDIRTRYSEIYDLYFVVIVWILTRITDFFEFGKVSFALMFLIAYNLSLGIQMIDKSINKKLIIPMQIIFNAILIVIFYFVTPKMFWYKEPGIWIFVVFYGLVYGLITYLFLDFASKIITLEITAIVIIIIGFWFMNPILIIIFIIITVIIVLITTGYISVYVGITSDLP